MNSDIVDTTLPSNCFCIRLFIWVFIFFWCSSGCYRWQSGILEWFYRTLSNQNSLKNLLIYVYNFFQNDMVLKYVLQSSGISWKSAAFIVRYSLKREYISIVLRILQLLKTLEPLDRFKWGFQQNVPLQMSTSIK